MAKKISQLTQATQVKSDDVTVIVQDGETKKLPLNTLVTKQDIENKKVAGLAKLDEIEATYENDTYTPTITVKNRSSVKTGEGDEVDYSANVMDGHVKSAILKGSTKYRDIDTGEVLDAFEDGRNLELVSVKMPVLTTCGKNLFNTNFLHEPTEWSGVWSEKLNINDFNLKRGETYFFNIPHRVRWFKDNAIIVEKQTVQSRAITIPLDFDDVIFDIYFPNITQSDYEEKLKTAYIVQGSTSTTYEPYKTNILTVNEDVELRGIGDVQDTLDCLTGEVTKRVLEYSITGDEGWVKHATTNTFFTMDGIVKYSANKRNVISDKFIGRYVPSNTWLSNREICVFGSKIGIGFDGTLEELIEYLKLNNPRIFYVDEEKSIKTVDLMPSGTHPSTTPYCWKNGHIQLSSSGLLPNLEYSVVTSRAGQINQNATMIVKNDKRIFDLEILLAGGLVNTTYQALTLQNQVETGLSKVSLNSETEPDYLLYHMIMKLIEEKAYKLDDLTEKVNVFYLYEKLSDEQFETIYSALYPFAEDEIVEEPVVEELPEVVEDEVIM